MSEPFIGEIQMFSGIFRPRSWSLCDGQLLNVSQNAALFSLFGTVYGGDGRTTFGLPDLRGRVPVHRGPGPGLSDRRIGQKGGQEDVTLVANQIPAHKHELQANTGAGTDSSPTGNVPAQSTIGVYKANPAPASIRTLKSESISRVGGSQRHTNMAPFQCVNFIVALYGIYPSRS